MKLSNLGELSIDFSDTMEFPAEWRKKFEKDQALKKEIAANPGSGRRLRGFGGGRNFLAFII